MDQEAYPCKFKYNEVILKDLQNTWKLKININSLYLENMIQAKVMSLGDQNLRNHYYQTENYLADGEHLNILAKYTIQIVFLCK